MAKEDAYTISGTSTRTDIRNALRTLYGDMTDIKTIYLGRRRAIPASAMPAICIYANGEEKELNSIGSPREFERKMEVVSEIHIQGTSTEAVEALLDQLCAVREAIVLSDETLSGMVESIFPDSDEYEVGEDGRTPGAVAICTDVAVYVE